MLNNDQQLNVAVQNWFTNEEAQTVTYADNNNNMKNIEHPNKFGYKMTESILSPNAGEEVTYNSRPISINNDGGLKILYDGITGATTKLAGRKLPPIGT